MSTPYIFNIEDVNTEVDHADEGQWRCYMLDTQGDNYADCLSNAQITEVDQDGGDLRTYDLNKARDDVRKAADRIIDRYIERQNERATEAARDYNVNSAIKRKKEELV